MKKILDWMKAHIDKVLHFTIWYGGTLSALLLWGILTGIIIGVIAAVLKEIWDYFDYGWDYDFKVFLNMSIGDFAADSLGILIALTLFTISPQ
ncbi:MAG: hypothetical protein ACPKOP_03990 [Sphaerochaetaceae bacterium]